MTEEMLAAMSPSETEVLRIIWELGEGTVLIGTAFILCRVLRHRRDHLQEAEHGITLETSLEIMGTAPSPKSVLQVLHTSRLQLQTSGSAG